MRLAELSHDGSSSSHAVTLAAALRIIGVESLFSAFASNDGSGATSSIDPCDLTRLPGFVWAF